MQPQETVISSLIDPEGGLKRTVPIKTTTTERVTPTNRVDLM